MGPSHPVVFNSTCPTDCPPSPDSGILRILPAYSRKTGFRQKRYVHTDAVWTPAWSWPSTWRASGINKMFRAQTSTKEQDHFASVWSKWGAGWCHHCVNPCVNAWYVSTNESFYGTNQHKQNRLFVSGWSQLHVRHLSITKLRLTLKVFLITATRVCFSFF